MRQNWLNFDKKRYRYLSRLKPLFLIVAGFFFFGGGGVNQISDEKLSKLFIINKTNTYIAPAQVFYCEYCKILKNTYFGKHL